MKNNNSTITIGMPVYNAEHVIEKAIESILNQTYQDFQLIISNNGSTDKTDDLSIKSVFLNLFTQCCIFPYSLYFKLYPIAIANFSLGLCDIVLIGVYLKNKYFKNNITPPSSLLP